MADDAGPRPGWPVAAATGLGAMPGTDIDEAVRIATGELPELPFLPWLPARGVGADLAGRSLAVLVDIWADVVPSGWRISRRPSRDVQRGKDFLARDLDALTAHAFGVDRLKLQLCGPWTLGALVELPSGHRMITDAGAMRDLTASLAEGTAAHLTECAGRLPGTRFVIQCDEPLLPAVLAGSLSSASGLTRLRPVERSVVRDSLRAWRSALPPEVLVIGNAGRLASGPDALAGAGFEAVRVDFTALGRAAADLDRVGELLSAGVVLLAGTVPASPVHGPAGPVAARALPITEPLRALGFGPAVLAEQIIPTPAGGLAQATDGWARDSLRWSRDIARLLAEGSPRLVGS